MASNLNESTVEVCESYFDEILRTDAIELLKMCEKYVKVVTIDNKEHFGFVHTIDPVTKSYVLVKSIIGSGEQLEIIPGCSIVSVCVAEPDENQVLPDVPKILNISQNEKVEDAVIMKRKEQILAWFEQHLIKLEISPHDSTVLILKDALSIRPPYKDDDCLSNNEIILAKMRELLKSMPSDFNSTQSENTQQ